MYISIYHPYKLSLPEARSQRSSGYAFSIMVRGSDSTLKSTQMFGRGTSCSRDWTQFAGQSRRTMTRPINFYVVECFAAATPPVLLLLRPAAQQRANICPADRKQVCDLTKKATENVNCAAATAFIIVRGDAF
jgi:hypothetical protein